MPIHYHLHLNDIPANVVKVCRELLAVDAALEEPLLLAFRPDAVDRVNVGDMLSDSEWNHPVVSRLLPEASLASAAQVMWVTWSDPRDATPQLADVGEVPPITDLHLLKIGDDICHQCFTA